MTDKPRREDISLVPPILRPVPFKTWVKVDGRHPDGGMADAHRSKDRLILRIGGVRLQSHAVLPEHGVSIEMGPVLRHFRDLNYVQDVGDLAPEEEEGCGAQLKRDRPARKLWSHPRSRRRPPGGGLHFRVREVASERPDRGGPRV